ncbi:MAG TPA: hypothetical protein ENJ73_00755, partial [Desulfobacterales bacterium]|nr:hypothetical protein [Desulfobacterales bacterium]
MDAEGSGGFSLLSLRGWQAWWTVDDGGVRLDDRSIAFRLRRLRLAAGQPIQWLGLQVQSGESVLQLDGFLDAARRLRLAWRTPGLRPADFAGHVALWLVGEGTISSLPTASLRSANLGASPPWSRLAVRFAGTVEGRRLQVSGILADLPSSPVWEGVLTVQGWSGADLRRVLAAGGKEISRAAGGEDWPEISGLSARLYLHYRPGRPLQGSISVQEMTLAGLAVQGSGRFSWRDRRLLLRDVECSSPVGRLWEGEGFFRSRTKWRLSTRFAGETQKILAAVAASPSAAALKGVPARLSGRVRLDAGQEGIGGQVSFAPVPIGPLGRAKATLLFRLKEDGLEIDRGTIASDAGNLAVHGALGRRTARLRITAGFPDAGKIFSPLSGGVDISGTVEGTYDHPRLAATFRASELKGKAGMGKEIEGSVVMADLFRPRSAAVILTAGRLQVAGRDIHGLRLALHPIPGGWRLTQLEGEALDRRWRLQRPVRIKADSGEGAAVWRIEGLSLSADDGTVARLQGERRADGGLRAEVTVEGGGLLPLPLTADRTRFRLTFKAPPFSVDRFSFKIHGNYQGRPVVIHGAGRRPAPGPLETEISVLLAGRQVARFAGSVPLGVLRQKNAWRQAAGELHVQALPLDLLPPSWLGGR